MTEVGWLSLATSLLTLIGLLFKYWVDAAYRDKIVKAIDDGKSAVNVLEKQINSNMSKQIDASISAALSKQALQFNELWTKEFGNRMPETREKTGQVAAVRAEEKIASSKSDIKENEDAMQAARDKAKAEK